jgi:hypothetical protein
MYFFICFILFCVIVFVERIIIVLLEEMLLGCTDWEIYENSWNKVSMEDGFSCHLHSFHYTY